MCVYIYSVCVCVFMCVHEPQHKVEIEGQFWGLTPSFHHVDCREGTQAWQQVLLHADLSISLAKRFNPLLMNWVPATVLT